VISVVILFYFPFLLINPSSSQRDYDCVASVSRFELSTNDSERCFGSSIGASQRLRDFGDRFAVGVVLKQSFVFVG
jgi:hypothetical protein